MRNRSPVGNTMMGAAIAMTLAQLKTLSVAMHEPNELFQLTDGRVVQYKSASVLTADDIFVFAPGNSQAGRYVLAAGFATDVKLAIAFGTADAAVLATLPTNSAMFVLRSNWEVTADWTGGSSSAIGLSSSQTGHTTKGDLLGGAAGDVAAALTAAIGFTPGTIGADMAAGVLLKGGSTVRFDRITSAFTAGTGFAHLVGFMLANPGA